MDEGMTRDDLALVMKQSDLKGPLEGKWLELPEGRTLTLHLAHNGATLSVSTVQSLLFKGARLVARNERGELFSAALDDMFACSLSPEKASGRQAGFR